MIEDLQNKPDDVSQKDTNPKPQNHQPVKVEPNLAENEIETTDL